MFPPRVATEDEILKIHTKELLDQVKKCSKEGKPVTRDTPAGPETFEIAALSLGGALMAGDLVEKHHQVFVLCRPPGHHATRDRAGGFCFFNNMAALGISLWEKGYRPMIIDWDVHHGNGTQDILYELPIMYVSFHQKYLYPHSGSADETGAGDGLNYTKNFPLPIGMKDKEYLEVFGNVRSIAEELKPDIILISAGQDAHHLDRLSGLRLSSEAYREMGRIVGETAQTHCEGRIILLLEGGYHLEANAEALSFAIMGIREHDGMGCRRQ
jgi:acetoin utilization deacetylase AcuC-like enzyme